MKAQYKNVLSDDEYVTHKPIIEINDITEKEHNRMCNCCKTRSMRHRRIDISLGCDNSCMTVCICEQCAIVFHDLLSEYLGKIGGESNE